MLTQVDLSYFFRLIFFSSYVPQYWFVRNWDLIFFLFSFYIVIIMPRGAGLVGLPGLTQVIYLYIYIDFFKKILFAEN